MGFEPTLVGLDGVFAPFQGAGFIGDGDPGWASFLGRPGAIGCNASGVGEGLVRGLPLDLPSSHRVGVGVGIGIGIVPQPPLIPIPIATPTPTFARGLKLES